MKIGGFNLFNMKKNKNQHEEITLEKIFKLAKDNGYNLISDTYINSKTKLIFDDNCGYKYSLKYSSLIDDKRPFHTHNKFSIDNIILFLKKIILNWLYCLTYI